MLWDVTTDLPSSDDNSILNNLFKSLDKVDKTKVDRGNEAQSKASKKCNIGREPPKNGKNGSFGVNSQAASYKGVTLGHIQVAFLTVALGYIATRVV
jgi:hypothetical protein